MFDFDTGKANGHPWSLSSPKDDLRNILTKMDKAAIRAVNFKLDVQPFLIKFDGFVKPKAPPSPNTPQNYAIGPFGF